MCALAAPRAAGADEGSAGAAEPPTDPREVEVRAPPLTPVSAARDPSVAGSTIHKSELERPGLDAADALRTQVGTSVTETGGLGAPATASIRGATAAQTPVYLGGVRINDDTVGAADLSTLPLWLIDRIEVYRGNAPFEADRFGIGGAIFFEPLRPHDARLGLGASAGSYGSGNAFGYATAGNAERGLLVGLSLGGANNDYRFNDTRGTLDTKDDRVEPLTNADASLLDFWLIGRSDVGRGSVDVTVNHFEREQGAPRLAVTPTLEARQRLERNLASVAGRAPLGNTATLELRTTALLARATLDNPHDPPELLPLLGAEGHRLEQRGERVEQEFAARFEVGAKTRARVVLNGSSERLRRYERAELAGHEPVLDAERLSGRIAGMAEHDATRWLSLRALLAIECHSTATGGTSKRCDRLDPAGRLGTYMHAGELSGFAGIARYTRPPTLGELFGTSLAVHGNPALVSEAGVTLDAGARFAHALPSQARPLYAAASGYFRRATDLVSYVRTSEDYVIPKNIGVVDAAGLELEAGVGFARYLAANVGVTLADFRDHTPGSTLKNDVLPYHSRLVLAPTVEALSPRLGHLLTRATLGARLLYQSSRYADFAGLEVIPEQVSLDLDAALFGLDGALALRGRIADMLGAERYDAVGFPLPGRSVFVSLEAHLGPL